MDDFTSKWFPIFLGLGLLVALGGLVTLGVARFLRERRMRAERDARPQGHFVFAKIMDTVGPMERGDKYEDPLGDDLEAQGLGMVTGGGTQLDRDGNVEWIGLDLELTDLDRGVEFARIRLRDLGAPPGSVLEYREGGQKKTVEIA